MNLPYRRIQDIVFRDPSSRRWGENPYAWRASCAQWLLSKEYSMEIKQRVTLWQKILINTTSVRWSGLTSIVIIHVDSIYTWLGMAPYLHDLPLKIPHHLSINIKTTSDKAQVTDIIKNIWPVLLKIVKVT